MKIAFIDFRIPEIIRNENTAIGGWPVELLNWITGLELNYIDIYLLTDEQSANEKHSTSFKMVGAYDQKYKGIKYIKYIYYIMPKLFFCIKRLKPDIFIQGCASLDTGLISLICKLLNVPFLYRVVSDLDVEEQNRSLKRYELVSFHLGLKFACGYICQNQYQYDTLSKRYPSKPNLKLYNPFFCKTNIEPNNKQARSYIAWVGNFRWQKNLPLLYFLASSIEHVRFKVAGAPNARMDKNTQLAYDKLTKLQNVEFVGHINNSNILDFLNSAIALVNTSEVEGFSNTFLEAFSVGTPVITREKVDPDQIIKNNNLGFSGRSDSDLITAITEFWEMPSEAYRVISQNCFDYVRIKHDPKILSNELISFISKIKNT
ncbi:glycosyltransferase family 4 protein [Methylomonas sp. MgM2]